MIYPTARYNLNFDVCALCLNVVLFLFYFAKRHSLRERRVRLFMILLVFMCFSAGGELYMSIFRNGAAGFSVTGITVITALTQFFHNSLEYILFLYLLEVLGATKTLRLRHFFLSSIPELFLASMILVPPLRGMLFWYDTSGGYHDTLLLDIVYYGVVAFYSVSIVIALIIRRKALERRELVTIAVIFAGFLGSMIPAFINTYLRSTIFIQSLCVLGIYIMIENDSESYDADTGLRSRYALWKETRGLFGTRRQTYILSLKVRDLSYHQITLGTHMVTDLYHAIGAELIKLVNDDVHLYRTDDSTIIAVMFSASQEEAEKFGYRLIERFRKDWVVNSTPLYVSAQVQISSIPDRIAKEEQLNAFVGSEYDPHVPEGELRYADELRDAERRASVERALVRALANDSLKVYYQPIYDTSTGLIHSAEALSRMIDEELGFVPPDEFIRVAEQTGMIMELGERVFEKVCRFLSENKPQQWGLDFVEVNLSTVQCMNPSLTDSFISIMDRYHVSPDQISLEITESSVVHDEAKMLDAIARLKDAGFSFALDDFGTGNANYSYVMKYPFRLIKIDKSFLWNAENDPDNEAILLNMLQLVRGLHRLSVVEGVETEKQRDFLAEEGVTYLQGFYYSKPVPEDEFLRYLKEFNGTARAAQQVKA